MKARTLARRSRCSLALAWPRRSWRRRPRAGRRSRAPGPRELQLPPLQKLALSNGLLVLLVEACTRRLLSRCVLVVRAGAAADPVGREGIAAMTADMLDEGAAGKDALALADAVDFLGAELGTGSSWDAATVACTCRWPASRPRSR